MAKCARCSAELGGGGIGQEDGALLCAACDRQVHAAAEVPEPPTLKPEREKPVAASLMDQNLPPEEAPKAPAIVEANMVVFKVSAESAGAAVGLEGGAADDTDVPAAFAARADSTLPSFCPKCSAVWDRSSTSCPNCGWDVVAKVYAGRTVKVRQTRPILGYIVAVGLAALLLAGAYVVYQYAQNIQAEHKAEEARVEKQEAERREAAAQARVQAEEQARRAAEEKLRDDERRTDAAHLAEEQAKVRQAELEAARTRTEKERQQRELAAKRQQEADAQAAERRRQEDQAAAARQKSERETADRDQQIAKLTQDLKDAAGALKSAQDLKDATQAQLISYKNRADGLQRELDALQHSMTAAVIEKQKRDQAAPPDQNASRGASDPMSEQVRMLSQRVEARQKELADVSNGRDQAAAKMHFAEMSLVGAKAKLQAAKDGLTALGIDPQDILGK